MTSNVGIITSAAERNDSATEDATLNLPVRENGVELEGHSEDVRFQRRPGFAIEHEIVRILCVQLNQVASRLLDYVSLFLLGPD